MFIIPIVNISYNIDFAMSSKNGNIFLLVLLILAVGAGFSIAFINRTDEAGTLVTPEILRQIVSSPTPEPTPNIPTPPNRYQLEGASQVFQTFNNCGPASLSMALSLYNISASQSELGNELRPYQNAAGDNDDKSVTLEELADKAKDYGLLTYHRPNGDMDLIEKFVSNDMPVITRTLLHTDDDIGHYRVITGYNKNQQYVVQNDSLQGQNLQYSYTEYLSLWKPYGYEYLVLVPKEKQEIAEAIIGEDVNELTAWKNNVIRLQEEIANNPNDIQLKFSLSVAYYNAGEYQKSIDQFEEIESRLSFRTLWYQIEPLLAYQKLERYSELLPRIEQVLNNHNRAFSELYQTRGEIYLDQGRVEDAKREFETALVYNHNFQPAKVALALL